MINQTAKFLDPVGQIGYEEYGGEQTEERLGPREKRDDYNHDNNLDRTEHHERRPDCLKKCLNKSHIDKLISF